MPNLDPIVSLGDIESLGWATKKKVTKEETSVVTRFSFETEPTPDQLRSLHNLLKSGKPLQVTFRCRELQMQMELDSITEEKRERGEGTETD